MDDMNLKMISSKAFFLLHNFRIDYNYKGGCVFVFVTSRCTAIVCQSVCPTFISSSVIFFDAVLAALAAPFEPLRDSLSVFGANSFAKILSEKAAIPLNCDECYWTLLAKERVGPRENGRAALDGDGRRRKKTALKFNSPSSHRNVADAISGLNLQAKCDV